MPGCELVYGPIGPLSLGDGSGEGSGSRSRSGVGGRTHSSGTGEGGPRMVEVELSAGDGIGKNASPSALGENAAVAGDMGDFGGSIGERADAVENVGVRGEMTGERCCGAEVGIAFAAATLSGAGRDEDRRGGWGRVAAWCERGVGVVDWARSRVAYSCSLSWNTSDPDDVDGLPLSSVENESCEVERLGGAVPSLLPNDASLPNGRYVLRTRVRLRFAFFSRSSPIFFSTSAKTASIEMPSNRIDGMRMRNPSAYASSVDDSPRSFCGLPSDARRMPRRARGGETSSSASPDSSGLCGLGGKVRVRPSATARSKSGSKGGEVGLGLDEAERRCMSRGGVAGPASNIMLMPTPPGPGVEVRLCEGDSGASSTTVDISLRSGEYGVASLRVGYGWVPSRTFHMRRGWLPSGEDAIDESCVEPPSSDSQSSVKSAVDANEDEVDMVETDVAPVSWAGITAADACCTGCGGGGGGAF